MRPATATMPYWSSRLLAAPTTGGHEAPPGQPVVGGGGLPVGRGVPGLTGGGLTTGGGVPGLPGLTGVAVAGGG